MAEKTVSDVLVAEKDFDFSPQTIKWSKDSSALRIFQR
jgi:hypothetical protein